MASSCDHVVDGRSSASGSMMPRCESTVKRGEGQVVRTDIGSISPSVLRSSGISAMPMLSRLAARRAGDRDAAAHRPEPRPYMPRSTPNKASSSSRWPWPSRPPRPTTSPAPTLSEMSFSRSVQDKSRHSSTGARPDRRRGGFWRKDIAVFAADHHLDDFVVGLRVRPRRSRRCGRCGTPCIRRRARRSRACDARCRAAPCPSARSRFSTAKILVDVGGRQRRCRLVEDEDLRLPGERLGDLDHLPARQRQILDQRARMDIRGAGARQRILGDARAAPCGRSCRSASADRK